MLLRLLRTVLLCGFFFLLATATSQEAEPLNLNARLVGDAIVLANNEDFSLLNTEVLLNDRYVLANYTLPFGEADTILLTRFVETTVDSLIPFPADSTARRLSIDYFNTNTSTSYLFEADL